MMDYHSAASLWQYVADNYESFRNVVLTGAGVTAAFTTGYFIGMAKRRCLRDAQGHLEAAERAFEYYKKGLGNVTPRQRVVRDWMDEELTAARESRSGGAEAREIREMVERLSVEMQQYREMDPLSELDKVEKN